MLQCHECSFPTNVGLIQACAISGGLSLLLVHILASKLQFSSLHKNQHLRS